MSRSLDGLASEFSTLGKEISGTVTSSFNDLKKSIADVNKESKNLGKNMSGIKTIMSNQAAGLKDTLTGTFSEVLGPDAGAAFANSISAALGPVAGAAMGLITSLLPMDQITAKLVELKTTLLGQLEPLKEPLMNMLKPVGEFLSNSLSSAIEMVKGFGDAISNMIGVLSNYKSELQLVAILLAIFATGLATYIIVTNLAVICTKLNAIAMSLYTAAVGAFNVVMGIANGVAGVFGFIMAFLSSGIGLVTIAIMAVVAVGYFLIKNWDTVSQAATTIWNGICEFFKGIWTNISNLAMSIWNGISTFLSTIWNFISSIAIGIWNGICEFFKGIWTNVSNLAMSIWNGISTFLSTIWNAISSIAIGIWNGISTFIINIFTNISNFISTCWNGIKNIITTVGSAIGSAVSNVFNGIVTTVRTIMDTAKNLVSNAFNAIKNIFGAILKPNIKLPHLNISGKFSLNPLQVPKFGISWYATGGIFTGPSVIGVGENGDEAVLPLSNKRRMKPFANAVSSMIGVDNPNQSSHQGVTINIDNMAVRNDMDIKKIAEELNRLTVRENRKLGLI